MGLCDIFQGEGSLNIFDEDICKPISKQRKGFQQGGVLCPLFFYVTGLSNDACGKTDKAKFNQNLITLFTQEFSRTPAVNDTAGKQKKTIKQIDKQIIYKRDVRLIYHCITLIMSIINPVK